MENNYDLTTKKGIDKAGELLTKYSWCIAPIPWLIFKTFSKENTIDEQMKIMLKVSRLQ